MEQWYSLSTGPTNDDQSTSPEQEHINHCIPPADIWCTLCTRHWCINSSRIGTQDIAYLAHIKTSKSALDVSQAFGIILPIQLSFRLFCDVLSICTGDEHTLHKRSSLKSSRYESAVKNHVAYGKFFFVRIKKLQCWRLWNHNPFILSSRYFTLSLACLDFVFKVSRALSAHCQLKHICGQKNTWKSRGGGGWGGLSYPEKAFYP